MVVQASTQSTPFLAPPALDYLHDREAARRRWLTFRRDTESRCERRNNSKESGSHRDFQHSHSQGCVPTDLWLAAHPSQLFRVKDEQLQELTGRPGGGASS